MTRLTKVKSIHNNKPEFYKANIDLYPEMMGYEHQLVEMDCINKLGQLEDVMELFKINSIEQLINILEAWYTVKPGIYESIEITGKYHDKAIKIDRRVYVEGTEQYKTLKKALEVEDE